MLDFACHLLRNQRITGESIAPTSFSVCVKKSSALVRGGVSAR